MKLDLDRYNQRITQDLDEVVADIKQEGQKLGITHRDDSPSPSASLPKVKGGSRKKDGAINRLSVKFPRALVYTHKGAGKGRAGTKGSKWLNKFNVEKTTNPKSMGKMGTGGRTEKPFINNVLDGPNGVEKLATTAAEELGDAIVNKMLVK
jgi:hypothetical protein